MVRNFRFEEEQVALSGVPETPEAVDWLYEQGIRTVVSLHPVPEAVQQRLRARGMTWHPFLIDDFAAGVPSGFTEMLEHVRPGSDPDTTLIH